MCGQPCPAVCEVPVKGREIVVGSFCQSIFCVEPGQNQQLKIKISIATAAVSDTAFCAQEW